MNTVDSSAVVDIADTSAEQLADTRSKLSTIPLTDTRSFMSTILRTHGMFLLEEGMTTLQPIRSIVLQNGPQRKTPYDVITNLDQIMAFLHFFYVFYLVG